MIADERGPVGLLFGETADRTRGRARNPPPRDRRGAGQRRAPDRRRRGALDGRRDARDRAWPAHTASSARVQSRHAQRAARRPSVIYTRGTGHAGSACRETHAVRARRRWRRAPRPRRAAAPDRSPRAAARPPRRGGLPRVEIDARRPGRRPRAAGCSGSASWRRCATPSPRASREARRALARGRSWRRATASCWSGCWPSRPSSSGCGSPAPTSASRAAVTGIPGRGSGLLGMLMGWWRVKVSSGCPLRGRLAAVER